MNTKTYYQYRSDKDTFTSALSPDTMKLIFWGTTIILGRFGISGMRAIVQVSRSFPICVAVFKTRMKELKNEGIKK